MRTQLILIVCAVLLCACATQTQSASQATTTPSPIRLPLIHAASNRVLFIQGDHVPDNGYPHSRIFDDGSKPESFTRLRIEVLEGDLKLAADEFILTNTNTVTAGLLLPYAVVVLGSNERVLSGDEVTVLTRFFEDGGSILTYADFQYGPNNWASDNNFLNQFGLEVFGDNFQPASDITDTVSSHPIMQGVKAIRGEGISQIRVNANIVKDNSIIAKCSPLMRVGCILPAPDQAKVQPGDEVACVVVRQNPNGGRLASVCDRNLFHNGPGPGSDLDQVDNLAFTRNLFTWLAKK